MTWVIVGAGAAVVKNRLAVLQLLRLPAQLQHNDNVLLSSPGGKYLLEVFDAHIPTIELANACRCNETEFTKIVDSIHTVMALDPEHDIREMILDLLKLGHPHVEE